MVNNHDQNNYKSDVTEGSDISLGLGNDLDHQSEDYKSKKKKPYRGAENPHLIPKWKLPPHMNIMQLLKPKGKKATDIPTYYRLELCAMVHCVGKCKNGIHCNFVHEDPRDIGLASVKNSYCAKKYHNNE
jgi:hypothetical protein